MQITDPTEYIELGARMRYLHGRSVGDKIVGNNLIHDNFCWFKEGIEKLGLRVTLNLFNRILSSIELEFETLAKTEPLPPEFNKLTGEQRKDLVTNLRSLEDTLLSEAKELVIASPIPRRFSLNHLLNRPGHILGKGVFKSLSDIAKYDLEFACRSIAFECPTAAAFHILRCVEECVRILYKAYFPRRNANRPWGPLTKELGEKPRKPKPDELLLEHLDHLRRRFRNPTDHPDKKYGIEAAEDLVHLAVEVINRVIRDKKVQSSMQ